MEIEKIEINDISFSLKIHYEKRKNCSVSIRKANINIRIPLFLSSTEQRCQLIKMKNLARNIIEKNPTRFKPPLRKEYHNGDRIKANNTNYHINITYKDIKHSSAKIQGETIFLCISDSISKDQQQSDMSYLLSRCIGSDCLPSLKRKILELNDNFFNQKINHIYLKSTISNWGSCSKAGNINISTRLLFAPDDVVKYVCIHELAHLIELNHSTRFWHLVQQVMPDYKKKIRWLKENAELCKF